MHDFVRCSDGIGGPIHDADAHPLRSFISESGHRDIDRESVAVESLDEPGVTRIEFCDLFLHSLRCGQSTEKVARSLTDRT